MWQECRRNLDIWWAKHGWAWPNSAGWTMRNHRYSPTIWGPFRPFHSKSPSWWVGRVQDSSANQAGATQPFTSWQSPEVTFDHFSDGFSCIGDDSHDGWVWPSREGQEDAADSWPSCRMSELIAVVYGSLLEHKKWWWILMNGGPMVNEFNYIQLIQWIIQFLSISVSFSASFCSKEISWPRARPGQSTSDSRTEKQDWKVTQVNPMIAASALRDCWWLNVINKC